RHRPLVVSQATPIQEPFELLSIELPDHECNRYFAELRVRPADDTCVKNGRMHAQHRLHLVRVDVRAAPDDDVLHTTDDVEESRLVDETEVAHMCPTVLRVGA